MSESSERNGGPPAEEPRNLAGRLVSGGTRQAQRVAGAAGLDRALETAIEEAIVRAVESDATERAVARILNGPMIEQAVQQALRSEAVEQALLETVDSEMVDRLWGRILDSDETQKLIERIAEAPEVRAAIASQGVGLIGDIGEQVSRVTKVLDAIGERVGRRIFFRQPRSLATDRAGFFTRMLGVGIDAIIVNIGLISGAALISLIASVFGLDASGLSNGALAVGALAWLGMGSLYLFVFWSLSGQTPGMRFLDIRIESEGESNIGPRKALRRLVGFWLAAIPFGLGFIGVLLKIDRTGFHDRLGGTAVYYLNPREPDMPHEQFPLESAP